MAPSILVPFADQAKEGHEGFTIPIAFADYVAFVEWAGRELVPEKRGCITGPPPAVLQSLGMEPISEHPGTTSLGHHITRRLREGPRALESGHLV